MMRTSSTVFLFLFLLTPAVVQSQARATAPATGTAQQPAIAPAVPDNKVAVETQGFDYNAEGRRDPFISLVRRGVDSERSAPGARLPGLSGLETAEVTLRGTMQSREGFVAIVQGSDSKTYIVRVGDRLVDGTIRAISQNALVVLQQVNDPLAAEKQREVRKTIRQADEAFSGSPRD